MIKKIGAAEMSESIQSNAPPLPGTIFPESFIPAERLNTLSIRSPTLALMLILAPKISCCKRLALGILFSNSANIANAMPMQEIKPPTKPAILFWGLL